MPLDVFLFYLSDTLKVECFLAAMTAYQLDLLLCNAVACPHLVRSGMGTACSRSASARLYHAGSRLLPCDGAAD